MAKDRTANAPTVQDIDNLKVEDLVKINGFADIKARSFVDGWKSQKEEIEKIMKHIKISLPKVTDDSGSLSGKSFCVTGTLSTPRNNIHKLIESNGGKVSSSVSSKLDYLIAGEDCGSKKDKALKFGVKIISEKDLMDMVG